MSSELSEIFDPGSEWASLIELQVSDVWLLRFGLIEHLSSCEDDGGSIRMWREHLTGVKDSLELQLSLEAL